MKRFYTLVLSVLASASISTATIAQTTFNFTGSLQTYTVPAGVTNIQILAVGAEGGNNTGGAGGAYGEPGLGASIQGDFAVTPGQVLDIVVGEQPTGGNFVGGGGGGTFVWDNSTGTLLIAAGGGGGSGYSGSNQAGIDAVITNDGTNGNGMPDGAGVSGNGGTAPSDPDIASGGTGWLSNGSNGTIYGFCSSNSTGGQTPLSGATGGTGGGDGVNIGPGGYGGGGGANARCGAVGGGGGGGYSGGGAGGEPISGFHGGGGGGSYNTGTSPVESAGAGTGHGVATITVLCTGLTYTVSDDTVCDGDMVTLHAASTVGGTVTWDGGVTDSVAFTPPTGSTTYTATSSDPGDCAFSVTIFVGDIPTVDAGADQDVCEGDSTMLNGTGTANVWTWDGGVLDGINFLPPPATTTTYTLTGTVDSTGCQATDMVDVNVVVVDVSITATGADLIANQTGATYQWLDCPALTDIAGETSQTFTPSADGDYAVAVTLSGCPDTSACQGVYVGIANSEIDGLEVYPNPSSGLYTIKVNGEFSYEVMNLLGELVLSGTAKDKELLDLSREADGTYVVEIIANDESQSIQLIKQ